MSPDNFSNVDQLTHPEESPSGGEFFTAGDIIELEWLIHNGLFDLSKYSAMLDGLARDFAGDQLYTTNNEGQEGYEPVIPDVRDKAHRHPMVHLRREMEPPINLNEQSPTVAVNSSEKLLVELEQAQGEASAQSNELANDPGDQAHVDVVNPSDAEDRGRCKRKRNTTPSQKVWRFKPYIYHPPVSKNKPSTSESSTLTPSSSLSSVTLPLSSTQRCQGEEDSPDPLPSAPIGELKKEEEKPATVSSKKRRGRVLFKHVPYDPRKLLGSQSATEFIEWRGPTDESFWGRRAFDESDNGKKGI